MQQIPRQLRVPAASALLHQLCFVMHPACMASSSSQIWHASSQICHRVQLTGTARPCIQGLQKERPWPVPVGCSAVQTPPVWVPCAAVAPYSLSSCSNIHQPSSQPATVMCASCTAHSSRLSNIPSCPSATWAQQHRHVLICTGRKKTGALALQGSCTLPGSHSSWQAAVMPHNRQCPPADANLSCHNTCKYSACKASSTDSTVAALPVVLARPKVMQGWSMASGRGAVTKHTGMQLLNLGRQSSLP
jgi:hypothetical protein